MDILALLDKKKLYGLFLWVGFNCLKTAKPLQRGNMVTNTVSPQIFQVLIWMCMEDKRMSQSISHMLQCFCLTWIPKNDWNIRNLECCFFTPTSPWHLVIYITPKQLDIYQYNVFFNTSNKITALCLYKFCKWTIWNSLRSVQADVKKRWIS